MSNSETYIDFAISSIFVAAFEDISAVGRIIPGPAKKKGKKIGMMGDH